MELWTSNRLLKSLCKENKKYNYCTRVRKYHVKVFRMVNSVFFRYDPIGIKKMSFDYGIPYENIEDEYYSEAMKIALKINSWDNIENLTNIIEDILYRLLDHVFDALQITRYCSLIAREIWNGRKQQIKLPKEAFMEDIMITNKAKGYNLIEVD